MPPPSWLVDGLDPAMDILVLTATRKNPANRYADMQALLSDLETAIVGQSPSGVPLVVAPDGYAPTTEKGQAAMDALTEGR